jgi:hypothetical protein
MKLLHPTHVPTRPFAMAAVTIPVVFVGTLVFIVVALVCQRDILLALSACVVMPLMACGGYALSVTGWHIARTQPAAGLPFNSPLLEALNRVLTQIFIRVFAMIWCSSFLGLLVFAIRDTIRQA